MPKTKLPVRKDGGCVPFLGGFVCKPTTTGILKPKHRRLIGRGLVAIPAYMAGAIPKYIEELPKDCMLVYQEEITELVRNQLCSWCDGHGWQPVNCMEDIVACSNCNGTGIEPEKTRRKLVPITSRNRERMVQILAWRKEGKTLEWIGRQLKVTRERVRQLEKLAEYRQWPKPK
jgi:hypothetical protein